MQTKMFSKLTLLVAILTLAVVAGVPAAFAEPTEDLADFGEAYAVEMNEPLDWSVTPKGESGSGWKPDASVASGNTSELDPSMGSYVDPGTGAVTLYVTYS